jgi:hypothetical protein
VYHGGVAFAKEVLSCMTDPIECIEKTVLAVPRCFQVKKGTVDRGRVNNLVAETDGNIRRCP